MKDYSPYCRVLDCPNCINWVMDTEDGYYSLSSCGLVGQSFQIETLPPDCPFTAEQVEFELRFTNRQGENNDQ